MDFVLAASCGKIDLLKQYLADGVSINVTDQSNETALIEAVKNDHTDVVEFLLEQGADAAIAGNGGFTALHHAAYLGRLEAVKLLVGDPAIINDTTDSGDSALMIALQEGHEAIATEILEQQNIDVKIANKEGVTALHRAAYQDYATIVRDLIVKGADTNAIATDSRGKEITALDLADDEEVKDLIRSQQSTSFSVSMVSSAAQLSKRQKLSNEKS